MKVQDAVIRRMRREDVKAVGRLEAEVFSMPWSEAAFLEMAEADYAVYLVAAYGTEIAGVCGVRFILDEGEITNVAVRPGYRRRGIGRRLLTELMKEAGKAGVKAFTLEVRAGNAPAIGLYESMGFVSAGIRPGFYEKPAEDALVMWKR